MAGQNTYFMLIYFIGNLPEKEACDSLSDSNKAVLFVIALPQNISLI
jgi:hypothetical protein